MRLKPCIDCGRLTPNPRCPDHAKPRTAPNRFRRPDYNNAEVQRRRATVEAWRAEHGDWCPGWGHIPPHPVVPPNVLTADHEHGPGRGGSEHGPLTVRCRVCNSTRGART